MEQIIHIPVLQKEVIQYLNPKPNENFIDCTLGQGGHALAIMEKTGPGGKLLGIDFDDNSIKDFETIIKNNGLEKRINIICDNFANLKKIVENNKFGPIHGILFDLGMSSWQLERGGRGFTFQKNEPLDMRYNPKTVLTAREIINQWPKREIEKILEEYGEEKFSRKIAEEIVREREVAPINTTFRLICILKEVLQARYRQEKIHFATRTFQALRIAVNCELDNLGEGLNAAMEVSPPGAVIAVISFHSLEDRIIKEFFRANEKTGKINIITEKPIQASEDEVKHNPRSRSAKLRAGKKI
ncbi:MAG: 16S rRNA (cytosine(1402)-N(4))-methyltransferase RsmH [Candidatus Parcubacteria bacterium]|nr:16S rRNA (cytosine(1402)-N(4))-methyltransferase RsmH [Candidatus Parcubacteria bacterium]